MRRCQNSCTVTQRSPGQGSHARDGIRNLADRVPEPNGRRDSCPGLWVEGTWSGIVPQTCSSGNSSVDKLKFSPRSRLALFSAPRWIPPRRTLMASRREGSAFSSPNRTPWLRCATPTTDISWRTAGGHGRQLERALRERGCHGVLSRLSGGDRGSFKDVKHYRRRKRWLS